MVRRLTLILTLVGLVSLAAAPAVAAAPPQATANPTTTVTGLLNGQPWTGTLTLEGIEREAGTNNLLAIVDLVGPGGINLQDVAVPLQIGQQPACDILTLDLGPLHLDLLGLVVDLAPVNLDITAVPGPGNLLGNLLCAVAGLLDGPSPLAGLIDRLLGIINGLLG